MEKNKTGKYLKYAVGEIILVILGILIALSINNWNENRKLKVAEQTSLKDLRTEVASNIEALTLTLESHQKSYDIAVKFRNLFSDREAFNVMPDSIFRAEYFTMIANSTFDPKMGILNSMNSSGKISNISNKDLLYLLSSLGDLIADALESQKRIERLMDNLIVEIYDSCSDMVNGQNQGVDIRCYYDNSKFRVMTNLLFRGVREGGIKEEHELNETFKHILALIDQEIEK